MFGEFGEFGRNASDERVLFDPGGPGGYRLMSALCGISGLGGVSHGPLEKPVGLVGPHPPDQSPAGPDDLGVCVGGACGGAAVSDDVVIGCVRFLQLL